jgi:acylphosphatase
MTEPGASDALVACRCIVAGRVQGVFFRASAARRARELGVAGHALNLEDGTVEVFAVGVEDRVQALCDWLRVGPPAARVVQVDVRHEAVPTRPPAGFSTG